MRPVITNAPTRVLDAPPQAGRETSQVDSPIDNSHLQKDPCANQSVASDPFPKLVASDVGDDRVINISDSEDATVVVAPSVPPSGPVSVIVDRTGFVEPGSGGRGRHFCNLDPQ